MQVNRLQQSLVGGLIDLNDFARLEHLHRLVGIVRVGEHLLGSFACRRQRSPLLGIHRRRRAVATIFSIYDLLVVCHEGLESFELNPVGDRCSVIARLDRELMSI